MRQKKNNNKEIVNILLKNINYQIDETIIPIEYLLYSKYSILLYG